ncbi:MAG: VWA domain-containing protein [Mariprofundaceae bacterium]|nr:VWA domain-containing protein [Mariprofundaceae bacterium]
MVETVMIPTEIQVYWEKLNTRFPQVKAVFADCMQEALDKLSPEGVETYLECACFLGKMGRGVEPILIYVEELPSIVAQVGDEALLVKIKDFTWHVARNTNVPSIIPFLQSIAAVARQLKTSGLLDAYFDLLKEFAVRTTGSVHGHHNTHPSPSLPVLLEQGPRVLSLVTLEGFRNWINYGVKYYANHPERQKDYFSLQTADSNAVLQRERHGTLFIDHENKLDKYMRSLWTDHDYLIPYSLVFDELRKPTPYYDSLGIRIPDVYDDKNGIRGIDRYRATLAHMAAHRRWSQKMVVDNWSPFQRLAVEVFEDSRVEYLAIQKYPGLKKLFLALHPIPDQEDLNLEHSSLIRLKLAIVSRAILDPDYEVEHDDIREFSKRFHIEMKKDGVASSMAMASIALLFIARTRRQSDVNANVYFHKTEVDYRDDNRHLWIYIESGDEEESFDHLEEKKQAEDEHKLPPRHYHEWDYQNEHYRPDWVSLYETLHPKGNPADIDRLLEKHSALAKNMKRILDMLKPQDKVRIRFQEEGSELDLDVALRSLIDFRSGSQPDPRINMSHRTDGRNIAVSLVLDLSQSLSEQAAGCNQSILELSQEAVTVLAWCIDQLDDPFAIGGFHSNTRHDVRYYHFKGFNENFSDEVKSRLAAMNAAFSTRMGAAMRHAGHYLKAQKADKKLMLILTDGEPADVDCQDERTLIEDAHKAVQELGQDGIYTYCINLDPKADEYVADIFGQQYTIIDHVDKLPERLPKVFMALTK